jgi:hypothetical protein
MKQPIIRRAEALERLRQSSYDQSRAKRKGTATYEEWAARKDAEIARLEAMTHGARTLG